MGLVSINLYIPNKIDVLLEGESDSMQTRKAGEEVSDRVFGERRLFMSWPEERAEAEFQFEDIDLGNSRFAVQRPVNLKQKLAKEANTYVPMGWQTVTVPRPQG